MNDDLCISELLQSLRLQPNNINKQILEIEKLISDRKYRQAFLAMNTLKEKQLWILTESDEKNLEKFWWEYAN